MASVIAEGGRRLLEAGRRPRDAEAAPYGRADSRAAASGRTGPFPSMVNADPMSERQECRGRVRQLNERHLYHVDCRQPVSRPS